MPGPHLIYIRDPKVKQSSLLDFKRRKALNREMDHARWVFSTRRKKRKQRHRDTIAAASRKRNR